MIDIKRLREDPERFRTGSRNKRIEVDIDRLLELDAEHRRLLGVREQARAEQKKAEKEVGPKIGQMMGRLKGAQGSERATIESQIAALRDRPAALKAQVHEAERAIAAIEPELEALLLQVPQPPDPDVPVGASADDNVELSRWNPDWFDTSRTFEQNRGFAPSTHIQIGEALGLFDVARGVKLAGARSYVLTGDGMRLHQAILRYALDFMTERKGFTPMSVPVIVREEAMVGTGFFPGGRDQSYHIPEVARGAGHDLYLTGTGEVGLMGLHSGEILDEADLPLRYTTLSTCFRREAGAAGKDTAGLYRIHQFDKVEQVVICRADEDESRRWHEQMIGFVQELLRELELPHRLIECCTADLGAKNAAMIDIECWMPGRGPVQGDSARPTGAYCETHSASRLYDFQCRRLNLRYRPGGQSGKGPPRFCHSLNNTVAASPRILIPIIEMYQNADGSVTIPRALVPYMSGRERIAPAHRNTHASA